MARAPCPVCKVNPGTERGIFEVNGVDPRRIRVCANCFRKQWAKFYDRPQSDCPVKALKKSKSSA